jgi:benzoyl-CoA reductase/2-hydroxyglutaryl-CoA dehydratase subunit BcrC/BadD/HgdB
MKPTPEDAWHELAAAYADRLGAARAAAAAGTAVIGVVGHTVPVELIVAAGAMPVQVTGNPGPTPLADEWLETFYDPDVRAICEQALRGELAFLRALVIPRSTEPFHKLYLSLRELVRLGRAPQMPTLLLYDLPHTQGDTQRRYGLARTQALGDALALLTARPVGPTRLQEAIRSVNAVRRAQQGLQHMRQALPCEWRGEAAQVLNGAARFMAPQRYAELLPEALRLFLAHRPPAGPRLLVKGVPLDHAALHRAVDAAGAVIVAEDDPWGTRSAGPLVAEDGDPMRALVQHYQSEVPCPRLHPRAAREAWFLRALDEIALDGVLFHLPAPDDVHGWDFPSHRAELARRGLPFLVLRTPQPDARPLREFVQSLALRTA